MEGTNAVLQGCFEATDWKTLCEPHGENVDGLTDSIRDYINFCVDTHILMKTIHFFPNNNTWVIKDIKAILTLIQRLLSVRIREGKEAYRRKLEGVEGYEDHHRL